MSAPTLEEFLAHTRQAFQFLESDYGYSRCPPPFSTSNPFVACYTNGTLHVLIEGEGWGTTASTIIEDSELRRVGLGSLLSRHAPVEQSLRRKGSERTQRERVSEDAAIL